MINIKNLIKDGVHIQSKTKLFNEKGEVIVSAEIFEELMGKAPGAYGFSVVKSEKRPEDARFFAPSLLTKDQVAAATRAGEVASLYKEGKSAVHTVGVDATYQEKRLRQSGGHLHASTENSVAYTPVNQILWSIFSHMNSAVLSFLLEDRTDMVAYGRAQLEAVATDEERALWKQTAIDAVKEVIAHVNALNEEEGVVLHFVTEPSVETTTDSCCHRQWDPWTSGPYSGDHHSYDVCVKFDLMLTRPVDMNKVTPELKAVLEQGLADAKAGRTKPLDLSTLLPEREVVINTKGQSLDYTSMRVSLDLLKYENKKNTELTEEETARCMAGRDPDPDNERYHFNVKVNDDGVCDQISVLAKDVKGAVTIAEELIKQHTWSGEDLPEITGVKRGGAYGYKNLYKWTTWSSS